MDVQLQCSKRTCRQLFENLLGTRPFKYCPQCRDKNRLHKNASRKRKQSQATVTVVGAGDENMDPNEVKTNSQTPFMHEKPEPEDPSQADPNNLTNGTEMTGIDRFGIQCRPFTSVGNEASEKRQTEHEVCFTLIWCKFSLY